jgi:hypothetical protein
VSLLSSIVLKRRMREENLKQESKEVWDGYLCKTKGIFIVREASRCHSNGHRFDSRAPTRTHRIENCASCVGYPDGQANYLTFQRKVHRDVTAMK